MVHVMFTILVAALKIAGKRMQAGSGTFEPSPRYLTAIA
jgi:hypothetical protein